MKVEPRLHVILDSPVPIYRQIVDQIRAFCVAAALAPGAVLPSVRQLAAALGVHHNTVGEAYRTLAEEGWLDVRHGRRVTVLDRAHPVAPPEESRGSSGLRLRGLVTELLSLGFDPLWIRTQVEDAMKVRAQ